MTRHRARPSFTVEIKRSRTSPLPDGERPQSERPASKPSAGLSPEAAGLFKTPGAPKAPAGAPAPSEPENRPSSPGRSLWAGTGLFEEAAAATQSGRFDPPDPPIFSKAPVGKALTETQADKALAAKDPGVKDPGVKESSAKEFAGKTPAPPAPAKRVLPSLIAPPEPEPEPEIAPEPEPKLPRVRRYRATEPTPPRRAAGPRPAFVWPEDWPDEAPIQTPSPITVPAAAQRQDRIELPKSVSKTNSVSESKSKSDVGARSDAGPPAQEAGEIRPRVKRRTGDEDLRIGQRWKRRLPRVCW